MRSIKGMFVIREYGPQPMFAATVNIMFKENNNGNIVLIVNSDDKKASQAIKAFELVVDEKQWGLLYDYIQGHGGRDAIAQAIAAEGVEVPKEIIPVNQLLGRVAPEVPPAEEPVAEISKKEEEELVDVEVSVK